MPVNSCINFCLSYKKNLLLFFLFSFFFFKFRATALVVAKVCKIQKMLNFIHFNKKNTYISACKSVQIYKIAIVNVHICTIIVALQIIILLYSLSHSQTLSLLLLSSFSSSSHTLSLHLHSRSTICPPPLNKHNPPPPFYNT